MFFQYSMQIAHLAYIILLCGSFYFQIIVIRSSLVKPNKVYLQSNSYFLQELADLKKKEASEDIKFAKILEADHILQWTLSLLPVN